MTRDLKEHAQNLDGAFAKLKVSDLFFWVAECISRLGKQRRTKHIKYIKTEEDKNNNKMERINNEEIGEDTFSKDRFKHTFRNWVQFKAGEHLEKEGHWHCSRKPF